MAILARLVADRGFSAATTTRFPILALCCAAAESAGRRQPDEALSNDSQRIWALASSVGEYSGGRRM